MSRAPRRWAGATGMAVALLCGCPAAPQDGEDGLPSPYPGPSDTAEKYRRGEELFRRATDLGGNTDNPLACVDCHNRDASDIAEDAYTWKPAHSLYGVSRRGTWLDGTTAALVDGVNWCLQSWMGAQALTEDDADMADVLGYLISISREGDFPALAWQVEPFQEADVVPGDAQAGADAWARACTDCHGGDGQGGALGPPAAGTSLSDLDVANTIRTGRGTMPFLAGDRFSDAAVMDVLAFLRTL